MLYLCSVLFILHNQMNYLRNQVLLKLSSKLDDKIICMYSCGFFHIAGIPISGALLQLCPGTLAWASMGCTVGFALGFVRYRENVVELCKARMAISAMEFKNSNIIKNCQTMGSGMSIVQNTYLRSQIIEIIDTTAYDIKRQEFDMQYMLSDDKCTNIHEEKNDCNSKTET